MSNETLQVILVINSYANSLAEVLGMSPEHCAKDCSIRELTAHIATLGSIPRPDAPEPDAPQPPVKKVLTPEEIKAQQEQFEREMFDGN